MTLSAASDLPPVLDPQLPARYRPDAANAASEEAMRRVRDAAFSELAAGVVYEFETLASDCLASLAKAFEAAANDGQDTRSIETAQRATESMAATVRGLKSFTTEDGQLEGPVNVHEALELALRLAGPTVRMRATVERRYAPTALVVASIPRLARVFSHVLRNAGESIPGGLPDANHVTVQTGQDARGHVTIVVTDTGLGIEQADLPFVFDPFFTTKKDAATRGLGLTAARSDVRALGGEIAVESLVGRGTRVRITLPAASGVRLSACLPTLISREVPPSRILSVAESHAAAVQVAQMFSDGPGFVFVATWTEAIERLSLGEQFDLVVCDARTADCGTFRARVRELLPDARARVFDVSLAAPEESGVFPGHRGSCFKELA